MWIGKLQFVQVKAPGWLHMTTVLMAGLLGLLFGLFVVMPGSVAYAATSIVVNTLSDGVHASCATPCTLRDAITAANVSGGTITFDIDGTIVLTGSLPTISNTVTIDGSGHAITVSGNNLYQVLIVNYGQSLILQAITIAKGSASNGGGIYNSGALTVTNSTLSGNGATTRGGGIYNSGTLSVINSAFSSNNAPYGGGLYTNGTLSVINSTFSGNTTKYHGGGIENEGTLSVINSTFSYNNATYGGGIYNYGTLSMSNSTLFGHGAIYGGGIYNYGTLSVTNSTLAGNYAPYGGGGIYNYGTLSVINSTLISNGAQTGGGGIYNAASGTSAITNTIIAYSTVSSDCVNSSGTVTGSHNLIKDTTNACGLTNLVDGNIIGMDPLLGEFATNGGATITWAPLPGSPAINAGTNAGCPAFDQRGFQRPIGGTCDIGAVEWSPWAAYLPLGLR